MNDKDSKLRIARLKRMGYEVQIVMIDGNQVIMKRKPQL